MSTILEKLLRISSEETSFAKRGFCCSCASVRMTLERVGETFLSGYHAALADKGPLALAADLETVDLQFRGFAYEGASMALAFLDQLAPWKRGRLSSFAAGPGLPHIYMVHVGAGWAMARLPFRIERRLAQLDPLLRWLALDGFGFHEGYFRWQLYQNGRALPRKLRGYQLRAFDQGLGRSLWFVGGADSQQISRLLAAFPASRLPDLWSGIGLACTYAGGADAEQISGLREASGKYFAHLAQGVVFAAKAREQAGNITPHTERACRSLCALSVQEAARIADATLPEESEASSPECPAYETWRRRIRMHFVSSELDGAEQMKRSRSSSELDLTNTWRKRNMFNSKRQNLILNIFIGLMILHWAEHLVQAYQIYVLGYPRHHAMGLLGQIFPWLMHSEWLHFGYAFLTLVGVLLLWSAFTGAARKWWNAAVLISIWHLIEHTLLFAQAQGGFVLWGAKEPTSILQLFLPRVELHLFYNTLVTIPIVVAMVICWKKKKASPETVQVAAA